MKEQRNIKLKTKPTTYYVWVAGSCDYGHEERCSGGAYVLQLGDKVKENYVINDDHTTEFRMILTVMAHAMEVVPEGSDIVFLTNVSYIHQNWNKEPTEKSANTDLINLCRNLAVQHRTVEVKLVPFHKYTTLLHTNDLAHETMMKLRNKK